MDYICEESVWPFPSFSHGSSAALGLHLDALPLRIVQWPGGHSSGVLRPRDVHSPLPFTNPTRACLGISGAFSNDVGEPHGAAERVAVRGRSHVAYERGGGLYHDGGNLDMTNVVFSNNSAVPYGR